MSGIASGLGGYFAVANGSNNGAQYYADGAQYEAPSRFIPVKSAKGTYDPHIVQGGPYIRNGAIVDLGSANVAIYLDAKFTAVGDFVNTGMALLLAQAMGGYGAANGSQLSALTSPAYSLWQGAQAGTQYALLKEQDASWFDAEIKVKDTSGAAHYQQYHSNKITKAEFVFPRDNIVTYNYECDSAWVGLTDTPAATGSQASAPVPFTMPNASSLFQVTTGLGPAFQLAGAQASDPLTVATGVNDTFYFTGMGGAGSPELFTMAAGTYTGKPAIAAAVNAAQGAQSFETFGSKVNVTVGSGSKLLFTMRGSAGAADNGNTLTLGPTDVLVTGLGVTSGAQFASGSGSLTSVDGCRKITVTLTPKLATDRIYIGRQYKEEPVTNGLIEVAVAFDMDYTPTAKSDIFDYFVPHTSLGDGSLAASTVLQAVGNEIGSSGLYDTFGFQFPMLWIMSGGEAPLEGVDIIKNTVMMKGTLDAGGDAAAYATLITADTTA